MAVIQEEDEDSITGINVTPLVDIVLVLLIIFMVAAPLMSNRSIRLALPKVAHHEERPAAAMRVSLAADGTLSLDGRNFTREELIINLKQSASLNPGLRISVAADEKVSWADVAGLLDDIKGAGIQKIAAEVRAKGK